MRSILKRPDNEIISNELLNSTPNAELNLLDCIKKIILDFVSSKKNFTLRNLAEKRSDLCREYVRRLSLGEVKEKNLDFDKVVKLLSITSSEKKIINIINYYNDPIYSNLQKYLRTQYSIYSSVHEFEVEELCFANEESTIIYTLSQSENGVTFNFVQKLFGLKGIRVAEKLAEENILLKYKESYIVNPEYIVYPSPRKRQLVASHYLNHYKYENQGKDTNYGFIGNGFLNLKGMLAKKEAYILLHKTLDSIYKSEDFNGELPTFDVCFMDLIDSMEYIINNNENFKTKFSSEVVNENK